MVTPPAVAGLPGIVTIFSMPRLERSDGTHLRIGPGGGEMTMVTTWENRFELWKSVVRRCPDARGQENRRKVYSFRWAAL